MGSPKPKRQKVAKACNPCRKRKVKCDGVEPVCNRCKELVQSAATCTWELDPTQVHSQGQEEHIQWLESRVRQLEGGSKATGREIRPGSIDKPPSDAGGRSHTRLSPNPLRGEGVPASVDANLALTSCIDLGAPGSASSQYTPAILGTGAEEQGGDAFYGSSSAGTFMRYVKSLAKTTADYDAQPQLPYVRETDDMPASNIHRRDVQRRVDDYVLPSRRAADQLLLTYWQYVHTLYPILNQEQTKRDYEKVWTGDGSIVDEKSFLCCLNAIFAIATQLSGSTALGEREKSAAAFSDRAERLWSVLDPPTLRAVQAHLLLGFYFQSAQEPHKSWLVVGFAIRTAQSVGLHHPETSARESDTNRGELMRRVWYGCVLMDRVLSMTYGRPCEIGPATAREVPFPSTGQLRLADFYWSMMKLHDILHDVLRQFYRIDDTTKPASGLLAKCFGGASKCSIYDIDQRLSKWEADLPIHLSLSKRSYEDSADAVWHRQAVVLRQRQLHVKILFLRPVLSYYVNIDIHQGADAESKSVSPLFRPILLECAVACVQAAQQAIELIVRERSPRCEAVGAVDAWWYNVLFLYSSATCLVAARLTAMLQVQISEESIETSWRSCMEVLREYSTFNTSIQRLIATLNILFEAVPRQYSRMRLSAAEAPRNELLDPSNQVLVTPSFPYGLVDNRNSFAAQLPYEPTLDDSWLSDQFLFDVPGDFDFGFDIQDIYDSNT